MKSLFKFSTLTLIAAFMVSCTCTQNNACKLDEAIYEGVPFEMQQVAQTSFPSYSVNVVDYGAVADGKTLCTEAINNAIKHVSEHGGGTVIIPAGVWFTGPITLLSDVNLYTERNSIVVFSDDFQLYPIVETNFEGLDTKRCMSPIWARDAENIAITGYGTFDGSGDSWRFVKQGKMSEEQWKRLMKRGGILDGKVWYPNESSFEGSKVSDAFNVPVGIETDEEWEKIRTWLRPALLSIANCKRVLLQGVTFKNSPAWCLHPLWNEDLIIDGIQVSNPWYSQNGDALDLEACNRVLVINSVFDAGDDAICIKSGKDADGRRHGIPCQNVIIRNNTVLHGHGGFVVGSEMSGGVKNLFVDNCLFIGTDVGLRFKSTRGRGGVVENIHINNINMTNIPYEPVLFDLFYQGKSQAEIVKNADGTETVVEAPVPPVTEETPSFRDIHISNITCKGAGRAMYFNGLPEMPVKNVTVENVVITGAEEGVVLSETENVSMSNIVIEAANGKELTVKKSTGLKVNAQSYEKIEGQQELTF